MTPSFSSKALLSLKEHWAFQPYYIIKTQFSEKKSSQILSRSIKLAEHIKYSHTLFKFIFYNMTRVTTRSRKSFEKTVHYDIYQAIKFFIKNSGSNTALLKWFQIGNLYNGVIMNYWDWYFLLFMGTVSILSIK